MPLSTQREDKIVTILGAVCFFLSTLEFLIPKPLPFFRLGLANLPLLIGLNVLSTPQYLLLAVIKVIGRSLLDGTLFSYIFLFSLSGTASAALVMLTLHRLSKHHISFVGISIAGASASNAVQFLLARAFIFGESVYYVFSPLFIVGACTSLALGLFANVFIQKSVWYASLFNDTYHVHTKINTNRTPPQFKYTIRIFVSVMLFLLLVSFYNLLIQLLVFVSAVILCIADKQRLFIKPMLIMALSIVVFNLYPPIGRVLFNVLNMPITVGGLLHGIQKVFVLQGMIYLSKWALNIPIQLHGRIGGIISDSLFLFKKLNTAQFAFSPKNIIGSIDAILLSINLLPKSP